MRSFMASLFPYRWAPDKRSIEGIADYNSDGSLGLPQTDMELIRGEAETFTSPGIRQLALHAGRNRTRSGATGPRLCCYSRPSILVCRSHGPQSRLNAATRANATATGRTNSGAWPLFQWPLRSRAKTLHHRDLSAALLDRRRHSGLPAAISKLAILLVVPCYYFCTQSALHTEYRYVLVIHYFLFVLAAVAIYSIGKVLQKFVPHPRHSHSRPS